MAKVPREKIEEIRDRIRLEDYVGRTVRLERKGARLVGLCPFHSEKTPSFGVSASKQLYHCFGCGVGGDLIDFVMRLEGLDFHAAVRSLADAAGVKLPQDRPANPKERERLDRLDALHGANAVAQEGFRAGLERPEVPGRAEALAYLREERGLSDETIERFEIGWAPAEWQYLSDRLHRAGVDLDHATHLGLLGISAKTGRPYDRLRGRVTFPIRVPGGRVAGFGARRADWIDPDGPKYLNSPENDIYDKSSVLYGLHQARDSIRKRRQALIVEGYLDVILLAQAGFDNVVAGCGTALTPAHAKTLARLTDEVVTLYDGDLAGRKATHKAAALLFKAGCEVRVVPMPEGLDPDDLVRRDGVEAMGERITKAKGAIDYFLQRARAVAAGAGVAGTRRAVEAIRPLIEAMPNALDRDVAFDSTARELGIDKQTLVRHLSPARPKMGSPSRSVSHFGGSASQHRQRPSMPLPPVVETELLKKLMTDPEDVLTAMESKRAFDALSSEPVRELFQAARDGARFDGVGAMERLREDSRVDARWIGGLRSKLVVEEEEPHDLGELLGRLLANHRSRRVQELRNRLAASVDEGEQHALLEEIQRVQSGEA